MYLELLLIIMLFFSRMAICLETETIEAFLQSLHLDKFIILFKENDIDLDLLMNLTESKLMGLLTDIKLTHGNRYKIAHKIETIRALGKYSVCFAGFFYEFKLHELNFL